MGHNKNPIMVVDIMRNDVADHSSPNSSLSQISEDPTSKEKTSEITHNIVGHKENTRGGHARGQLGGGVCTST